jgi:CO/xanthine dehydrogenase FAD-binding subunit
MKAAAFDYIRPASLGEACQALADDEDARIIAGGQTLVPMLAMRLARPAKLVDIIRLLELRGISEEPGAIVIGATTVQVDVEHDARVRSKIPLLAAALPWVGHPPTRNRGTVGGSLALGDASAEIPLTAVTLKADIVLRDVAGESQVAADEFYLGPMMTVAAPAACLTRVRFPIWPHARIGVAFEEVSARRSDFALVAAAAQVALDDDGQCAACAVGVGGLSGKPIRLEAAIAALEGSRLTDANVADAVRAALVGVEALSDLHASADYRRRVAQHLVTRALMTARDRAERIKAFL